MEYSTQSTTTIKHNSMSKNSPDVIPTAHRTWYDLVLDRSQLNFCMSLTVGDTVVVDDLSEVSVILVRSDDVVVHRFVELTVSRREQLLLVLCALYIIKFDICAQRGGSMGQVLSRMVH